ncbi:uncharacterized protein LOC62_04G005267 [Vanrija pseudolonga]|uniref:Uncharacterized protein n=1 Tax=Vanrija pseudolonga TaxID=143232 RepID=A0AAF1BI04_9TREE|nr:hypothetical protein LOC62_04G005267 [Vanrija pseudolonga]
MRKARADIARRGSLSMDEWLEELGDRRETQGHDVNTLFVLRGASQAFRQRADALIFANLEVSYAPRDRRARLISRAGLPSPAATRIVPYKRVLNRVVDITSFVPLVDWGNGDRDVQIHPPKLVRRIGDGVVSRGAKLFTYADTLVDFIDLHPYPAAHDMPNMRELPGVHNGRLRHCMRRYIVHIRLDKLSTEPRHLFQFFPFGGGGSSLPVTGEYTLDVVLVIHPPAVPEQISLTWRAAMAACDPFYWVSRFSPAWFTVVTFDDIGAVDRNTGFRGSILSDCEDFNTLLLPRFVSMREWKGELDTETRELVTEWAGRESAAKPRQEPAKTPRGR